MPPDGFWIFEHVVCRVDEATAHPPSIILSVDVIGGCAVASSTLHMRLSPFYGLQLEYKPLFPVKKPFQNKYNHSFFSSALLDIFLNCFSP
jgi:hypothetical protein